MKNVLVTGGAGFIGSALCRALLASGSRVIAYDNLSFGRRGLVPDDPRCAFVKGDLRDRDALDRLLEAHSPDVVCHLAAIHFVPYCNEHPVEAVDVNVNGTRTLLEALRSHRPQRVLVASTAAVYPAEGGPFTEEHLPGPIDIYGYTKLMAEDLTRLFVAETGLPAVAMRFFNAFGPDDTNPHLVPDILAQVVEGRTSLALGNLEPVRDYVHVDDLVAGVVALLRRPGAGFEVFNIGSGTGVSVRGVVEAIGRASDQGLTIRQDPARVRRVERPSLVADVAKLRRETPWIPVIDFEDGIRRLVASLRPAGA